MNEFFWLICGVWCGIGGSIFAWFKLSKGIKSGEFSQAGVLSFVRGMAFWIFVPCLVLWILQFSVSGATQPNYLSWPSPQKYIALALQVLSGQLLLGGFYLKMEQIPFPGSVLVSLEAQNLCTHRLHLNFMPSPRFYQAFILCLVHIPNPSVKRTGLRPAAYFIR